MECSQSGPMVLHVPVKLVQLPHLNSLRPGRWALLEIRVEQCFLKWHWSLVPPFENSSVENTRAVNTRVANTRVFKSKQVCVGLSGHSWGFRLPGREGGREGLREDIRISIIGIITDTSRRPVRHHCPQSVSAHLKSPS